MPARCVLAGAMEGGHGVQPGSVAGGGAVGTQLVPRARQGQDRVEGVKTHRRRAEGSPM